MGTLPHDFPQVIHPLPGPWLPFYKICGVCSMDSTWSPKLRMDGSLGQRVLHADKRAVHPGVHPGPHAAWLCLDPSALGTWKNLSSRPRPLPVRKTGVSLQLWHSSSKPHRGTYLQVLRGP